MRKPWFPYLLLPLGILIGYLLPDPTPGAGSSSHSSEAPSKRTKLSAENHSSRENEKARLMALALTAGSDDISKNGNIANEISLSDIPGVLQELLKLSGPNGLHYIAGENYRKLLERWAAEDFTSALAWADRHPSSEVRKDALRTILYQHLETDLKETTELVLRYADKENLELGLEGVLFLAIVKEGAIETFDFLLKIPYRGGDSHRSPGHFPEGFDYPLFMSKLVEHQASQPRGTYLPFRFFPSDVLSKWAKIDRDSALDFSLTNPEIKLEGFSNVLERFMDYSDMEKSSRWLSNLIATSSPEVREQIYEVADDLIPPTLGAAPYFSLIEKLPDTALKQEAVGSLLSEIVVFPSSKRNRPYLPLINLLPDTDTKMKVIEQYSSAGAFLHLTDAELADFGLSRALLENEAN